MPPTVIEELNKTKEDLANSVAESKQHQQSAETLKAQVATLNEQLGVAIKSANDARAECNQKNVDLLAEQKAHAETKATLAKVSGDLEKANFALANPAFFDAAIRGAKPTKDGGSMAEKEQPKTKAEALTEYRKIRADGEAQGLSPREIAKQQAEYRKANAEVLGLK